MTEYQRIENELLSLGWAKEQAAGDHIKFWKKGVATPIVLAMGMSTRGRALQNCYAEIRKSEPLFPLGRQPHMIKATAAPAEKTPDIPPDIPEWMAPGVAVRWTGPEGRDWDRMKDPDSVMNRVYKIDGFKRTDDGTMAVLLDEATHSYSYQFVNEIDSWDTATCPGCKRDVPLSALRPPKEGDEPLCGDCLEKTAAEKKEQEKKRKAKERSVSDLDEMIEMYRQIPTNDPAMLELMELMKWEAETDDPEEKRQLTREMKEKISKLTPDTKKRLKKVAPGILAYFNQKTKEESAKKPRTPYEAWKMAINQLVNREAWSVYKISKSTENKIVSRYHSSTYTFEKIHDPSDRKKTVAVIVTVTAKEWEMTKILWSAGAVLMKNFREAFPGSPVFILLECPSAEFSQYVVDFESKDYAGELALLETLVPEEKRGRLSRARLHLALPDLVETDSKIQELVSGEGNAEEDGIMSFTEPFVPEEKDDEFESALPVYRTKVIATVIESKGVYGDICKRLDEAKDFGAPVLIQVSDVFSGRSQTFDRTAGYAYPAVEGTAVPQPAAGQEPAASEPAKDAPADDMLLKVVLQNDGRAVKPAIYGVKELAGDKDRRQRLVYALCGAAFASDTIRDVLGELVALVDEKAATRPAFKQEWDRMTGNRTKETETVTTSNKYDMLQTILDSKNPSSPNKGAGELTTRELLRELKERGLQFQNVSVIVKKDINMDEI